MTASSVRASAALRRGPSRRQVIGAATATAGVGAAGAILAPLIDPPRADASPATPSAAPVRAYGTPTDLARRSTDQAWTRMADGTVYTFDKAAGFWKRADVQDWATVLGFGVATLSTWGRPAGPFEVLMVFGTAPSSGPAPTPTPTPTGGGSVTPTPTPTPTPTGTQPAGGGGTTPTPSGSGQGDLVTAAGQARGQGVGALPKTGFDAERYGVIGIAAVLAGAFVAGWARNGDKAKPVAGPPEQLD